MSERGRVGAVEAPEPWAGPVHTLALAVSGLINSPGFAGVHGYGRGGPEEGETRNEWRLKPQGRKSGVAAATEGQARKEGRSGAQRLSQEGRGLSARLGVGRCPLLPRADGRAPSRA